LLILRFKPVAVFRLPLDALAGVSMLVRGSRPHVVALVVAGAFLGEYSAVAEAAFYVKWESFHFLFLHANGTF
jgi:hypothetical protein